MNDVNATIVISLARRRDRRMLLHHRLAKLNLSERARNSIHIIDAVDGQYLDDESCAALAWPYWQSSILPGEQLACSRAHPMRAGEIGCTLSHIAVWRMVLERGWREALILEDDAELCQDPAESVASHYLTAKPNRRSSLLS